MIYPVFPLNIPGIFPVEKPAFRGGNPFPAGENLVKNTRFFPQQIALKQCSTLSSESQFVETCTCPQPPSPAQFCPPSVSCTTIPTCLTWLSPALPCPPTALLQQSTFPPVPFVFSTFWFLSLTNLIFFSLREKSGNEGKLSTN